MNGGTPREWQSARLVDLATSVSSGTTTQRKAGARFPLYGSTGPIGFTDKAEFDGPSILVARVGANAGTVYQVDGRYGVSDNTLVVRLGSNHDVNFYTEVLRLLNLNTMVYGSGQPLVTGAMIKALQVPAISAAEQRRISGVQRDTDDFISSLERLITKKHDIKQGMMQMLLTGKTRLSGFIETWSDLRLGDVTRCIRGVAYNPSADLEDGDRPFTARLLRSNNVQARRVHLWDMQFVRTRRVSADQFIRKNDILICMANGSKDLVGKSALLRIDDPVYRYTFGAFMGVVRTNPDLADPRFVAYVLQSKAFRNVLDVALAGSSINNLRPSDVESFKMVAPDLEEQRAIANVLEDMDMELDQLQKRLVKAQNIKQGMAQELLTGRTRLQPMEAIA